MPQTRETSKASQHVAELIRSGLHTSLKRASAPQRGLRIRLRESLCQAGNARPAPGLLGERVRTISVPCEPPVQRQCLKQVFVPGPAKSGRPVGTWKGPGLPSPGPKLTCSELVEAEVRRFFCEAAICCQLLVSFTRPLPLCSRLIAVSMCCRRIVQQPVA